MSGIIRSFDRHGTLACYRLMKLYPRRLSSPRTRSYTTNNNVFKDNADKWWTGEEFRLLRCMNELRVPFITKNLNKPISESKIIDVGCGGGILSEPLARLGAQVIGIDPVFESIQVAKQHAVGIEEGKLTYKNCLIHDLSNQPEYVNSFDALIASEVLEHVDDVEDFLQHCTKVIKTNGSLFVTTINQTLLSYVGVIVFGEYILKQLPKGTHQYNMFVSVKGLKIMLERMGYHVKSINGFMYEPIFGNFHWTPTTTTHYALHAVKKEPQTQQAQINYQQVRNKPKVQSVKKPKIPLDKDEISKVIDFDGYLRESDNIVNEFEHTLNNKITTKATTLTIECLEITWPGQTEPVEIRDVAQISLKGNNLIALDFSIEPEAVKPAYNKLLQLGNMNPQIETNMIYCQLPKITTEYKSNLVKKATEFGNQAKTGLKQVFVNHSQVAKRPLNKLSGISKDLVNNVIENLDYHTRIRVLKIDELLKRKTDALLNQAH